MELLIPGLILVALMAWASTKIKKTAADAFKAESIQADAYSLQKPDGFLHVLGDPDHEFYAYSNDYGEGSKKNIRRATVTIDLLNDTDIGAVQSSIKSSAEDFKMIEQSANAREFETEEMANETSLHCFYKIVRARNGIYRIRLAALSEHTEQYSGKAREIFDSFSVRTN